MKFKYKKIILIITMCTMCIGMVTISLTSPTERPNAHTDQSLKDIDNSFAKMSEDAELLDEAGLDQDKTELKINDVEEVDLLVTTYYYSMLTCDLQTMAKVVTDVENIDVEKMQGMQRLIESYENIECYTLDGIQDGEYLVYVYCEVKFTGIETAAPGLNRLYIVTDKEGNMKIDVSTIKPEVQDLIDEADQSAEIKKIIDTVNKKLEQAINKDENLREFYTNLNGGSDEVDTDVGNEPTESSVSPTDEPIEDTEILKE